MEPRDELGSQSVHHICCSSGSLFYSLSQRFPRPGNAHSKLQLDWQHAGTACRGVGGLLFGSPDCPSAPPAAVREG